MENQVKRPTNPQLRYDQKNRVSLPIKLNTKTDSDILEAIEGCANKQGYIKALIRKDLEDGKIILKKF